MGRVLLFALIIWQSANAARAAEIYAGTITATNRSVITEQSGDRPGFEVYVCLITYTYDAEIALASDGSVTASLQTTVTVTPVVRQSPTQCPGSSIKGMNVVTASSLSGLSTIPIGYVGSYPNAGTALGPITITTTLSGDTISGTIQASSRFVAAPFDANGFTYVYVYTDSLASTVTLKKKVCHEAYGIHSDLAQSGGTTEIDVPASCSCQVSSTPDWLIGVPPSTEGVTQRFQFAYATNADRSTRQGTVSLTCGSQAYSDKFSQAGLAGAMSKFHLKTPSTGGGVRGK